MSDKSIALDKRISFTAADAFPIKIFLLPELVKSIRKGYIPPVHPSFSPTNKCNQNCLFCSYAERDRQLEMSIQDLCTMTLRFKELGAKAVDLTGGGEPLMHSDIEKIISFLHGEKMKLSLTTNALLLDTINIDAFTWIRVSTSSFTDPEKLFGKIGKIIEDRPKIDWNLSFVATRDTNYEVYSKLAWYANYYKMQHFRVVYDLLDLVFLPPIDAFKKVLKDKCISDSLMIFQDRLSYETGMKKCLISLIRPNVDAKGDVFPCCGTQYATDVPSKDFHPLFNMGSDYESIWNRQRYFDGSFCAKCYYGAYNRVLNALQSEVKHIEFV